MSGNCKSPKKVFRKRGIYVYHLFNFWELKKINTKSIDYRSYAQSNNRMPVISKYYDAVNQFDLRLLSDKIVTFISHR